LDEILIHKIKAGDLDSFEKLVSRYQRKIFSFVYRMLVSEEDARDITQEIFIQVFRSLETFRGDAKFSTWIYRVASNKCLDFLHKNKKFRFYEPAAGWETGEQPAGSPVKTDPESIYLREEKVRRVRRIIAGLPDKYRVALVLFHYEDLTYHQIAETLDIPVKTVATRLYRAKLILKERLRGETDGLP